MHIILVLNRPSQLPPENESEEQAHFCCLRSAVSDPSLREASPHGVLFGAQIMLAFRAPLRRPSWDLLSRLKFLPKRDLRGSSSTLNTGRVLRSSSTPSWGWLGRHPLLREACPGSPLRRSNNADIPRFSSTPLLGLT